MKIKLIIFLLTLITIPALGQDDDTEKRTVVTSQQIKVGSSIQYDWGWGYYYDEYNYYYSYSPNREVQLSHYDGPNTQVFVAYEYIWTYPATKLALAIEPKLGFCFREYMTNGFVGSNWKFYWSNTGIWRMGIYLYTGYEYKNTEKTTYIGMQNGMYYQEKQIRLNEHVMSFDLGLVPFQFTLRSIPLVIECNVNFFGMHVFKTSSEKYNVSEDETTRYSYSDVGGYGPRIELKLGWQIK